MLKFEYHEKPALACHTPTTAVHIMNFILKVKSMISCMLLVGNVRYDKLNEFIFKSWYM